MKNYVIKRSEGKVIPDKTQRNKVIRDIDGEKMFFYATSNKICGK